MARTDLVTTSGPNGPVILAKRVRALIADAAKSVGIDPSKVVVTQGSYRPRTPASGTSHTGGGSFDLRVWNLPAELHEPFVVALRARNVAAWKRDGAHGGFSPHIHGIVMDEPDLGRGAKWQADEYRAGRDGLSARGKDYHPRPKQHVFAPVATPTAPLYVKVTGTKPISAQQIAVILGCKTASVILFNPQLATSRASVGFKVRIPNGYPALPLHA